MTALGEAQRGRERSQRSQRRRVNGKKEAMKEGKYRLGRGSRIGGGVEARNMECDHHLALHGVFDVRLVMQ